MEKRLQLNEILVEILGSRNVYFQPPESVELRYPCIVYKWSGNHSMHASNDDYVKIRKYDVTVIDKNPDSQIPDKLEHLTYCALQNTGFSDNLNHWYFDLYF